jgi:hypothetical protein
MNCVNSECPDFKKGVPGNCTWRKGNYEECEDFRPEHIVFKHKRKKMEMREQHGND